MRDTEERRLAAEIVKWLDTPLQHLGDETRRNKIEGILIEHAGAVRRAAGRKANVQAFSMYGGAVGLLLTLGLNFGRILEVLGW